MMPDTSPADIFTWVGTALGAAIAAWGLRHGEKDKRSAPAPEPQFAGITANLVDAAPFREMQTDVKALRNIIEDWRRCEDERRGREQEERDRDRVDRLEKNQKQLIDVVEALRQQGAMHQPGRPLRDR